MNLTKVRGIRKGQFDHAAFAVRFTCGYEAGLHQPGFDHEFDDQQGERRERMERGRGRRAVRPAGRQTAAAVDIQQVAQLVGVVGHVAGPEGCGERHQGHQHGGHADGGHKTVHLVPGREYALRRPYYFQVFCERIIRYNNYY